MDLTSPPIRTDPLENTVTSRQTRLTEQERRAWQAYVDATTSLQEHLDQQMQHDARMRSVHYGLLIQLSEAPQQRLRMSELARNARISPSRLSHTITRLENRGWVRRETCATDRRGLLAVLTEEGQDVLTRATSVHSAALRQALFGCLSHDQQEALLAIMTTVANGLRR
ncbi:MarR family transcriptional regulator [Streptomyces sp. A0958]|uniref:MarR family winged helix-turn-helix transcriptional regulator n=1 Tax=Streptomyces sp. A0958 TaxID=2563101 RepID=UPI00109E7C15|nr:MarR family transcriptional regulator [Streptomyces sp. A0958]THA70098.1 MarR family transcriptional regulator [Streptomyces sp. A0958]